MSQPRDPSALRATVIYSLSTVTTATDVAAKGTGRQIAILVVMMMVPETTGEAITITVAGTVQVIAIEHSYILEEIS